MDKSTAYDVVLARIIELLEQGVVPWKSPFLAANGFPRNFVSQKEYSGINVFLLASARYVSPYFLTYKQAADLGGNVRKGEKGNTITKWGSFTPKGDKPGAKPVKMGKDGKPKPMLYLRTYTVFNAAQCDGIEFPGLPAPVEPSEKYANAQAMIDAMPQKPAIKLSDLARAFYSPGLDQVVMPKRQYTASDEAFYSTFFHELVHSTGHKTRLDRKSLTTNEGINATGAGLKVYAEEELVAEMGAAFLNARAGIVTEDENSAAYLKGWLKALKGGDAKTWLVRAASSAQKASEFILNTKAAPEAEAVAA